MEKVAAALSGLVVVAEATGKGGPSMTKATGDHYLDFKIIQKLSSEAERLHGELRGAEDEIEYQAKRAGAAEAEVARLEEALSEQKDSTNLMGSTAVALGGRLQAAAEYWKDAAGQAEDEATFLRGQYNEAEEKRSKAEAKVAQAKADRDEAVSEAVSIGRESKKLEAEVARLHSLWFTSEAEAQKRGLEVARLERAGESLARALDGTRYAMQERAEWAKARAPEECRHGGRQQGETPCPDCSAQREEGKPLSRLVGGRSREEAEARQREREVKP